MTTKTSARLRFCGAAHCVTGSCYHLEFEGTRLLIDCGVFQGGDDPEARNRAAFPFEPRELDAVVLTHGHLDHVGRVPLLGRHGFAGTIHGHPATLDIARLIMEDSARIGMFSGREPMYTAEDVAHAMARARSVGYRQPFAVGPFTVELFDAGHILGSASVRVSWCEKGSERAVLFSGDLGSRSAPILRDPNHRWDPEAHAVDVVVTESTYGDRAHPGREEARAKFRDAVRRAVSDGGKVLIPAFAIGRTQEVLYDLSLLVERGELPGVPVIVDGPLGLAATEIYERYQDCYDGETLARLRRGDHPLEFRDLYAAQRASDSQKLHEIEGPAIIVAGSGMCSGGRIIDHLAYYLPDERTDVIFVGYQARGTLGRALQSGADTVVIRGATVPVRAVVTTITGFSAHADRDQLASWFADVPRRPAVTAFVTHGEQDVAEAYAGHLADRFGARAHVPARDEVVELGRP